MAEPAVSSEEPQNNIPKGILFLITSAFFFALMAVFVKLAGDIHFVQKAFFRNAVAFIIALGGTIKDVRLNGRQAVAVPKGAMLYLFLRAIAGSVGVFGNFYAIDRILLADAAILNKMAPFFTILFSFIILREKIKPVPMICIIIAFLGSILIVKPSFNFSQMLPTLTAFMGGVGAGLAYASIRKLRYLGCNGKIIILFFSAFFEQGVHWSIWAPIIEVYFPQFQRLGSSRSKGWQTWCLVMTFFLVYGWLSPFYDLTWQRGPGSSLSQGN